MENVYSYITGGIEGKHDAYGQCDGTRASHVWITRSSDPVLTVGVFVMKQ